MKLNALIRIALFSLLFAAGMAAAASVAYYVGHDRGETQGKKNASLSASQLSYYNTGMDRLGALGYAWDGSHWVQNTPGTSTSGDSSEAQPDRSSCAEMGGTAYRSAAERTFYLSSCLGQMVTPAAECGTPANPWCFDLISGELISTPPQNFCDYLDCVDDFWVGTGYVIRCRDGKFSKTGGDAEACAQDGGVWQPLYSH
ncbi:MAG TPA: hypothetical protein VFY10_06625 [Dehalococcoidia bacterium]|nr:hypothetical protein [Dehalococcoidia bacterium]